MLQTFYTAIEALGTAIPVALGGLVGLIDSFIRQLGA